MSADITASGDDYPVDALVEGSNAASKPDKRVLCRRCPNADWVEEFVDPEDGAKASLRAYCSGLGGQWIWPQRNVGGCSARRRALDAERS